MLQVGEVSRRLGLNPQTLYFYERIGLMPSPKRTTAGYRLYDRLDLERLSFITQAKALGLSLDEIKELLIMFGVVELREKNDRFFEQSKQLVAEGRK